MKTFLSLVVAVVCGLVASQANATTLVISEIMYNEPGGENWREYVEIYNDGPSAVDLAGYVIDDSNSTGHAAANIAAGTIAAGGTAVFYDVDGTTEGPESIWGADVNWVAATGCSALRFGNGGDRVGIWDSFASYEGDHQTHANAVISGEYDDSDPWPVDEDGTSIYLIDLQADASVGSNWALSYIGDDHGGYESNAYGDGDIGVGSPGSVGAVPEPSSVALLGLFAIIGAAFVAMRKRQRS